MSKPIKDKYSDVKSFWSEVIAMDGAIAFWRCPREKVVHCIVDTSGLIQKGRIDLQTTETGFIVSPFLNPEGNETLFLQSDIYGTYEDGQWNIIHGFEKLDKQRERNSSQFNYHLNERPDTEISGKKPHFIEMVDKALISIEEDEFEKVVSARTFDEPLPKSFEIIDFYFRLAETYPDAFVSIISIPNRGTWIGATPELLLEYSKKHFRTVSVAGTQPFPSVGDISEIGWNQKEIEEQAMVSRYIIDQFKTIRLREFTEMGPRTVRAGNMIHLKTEYHVNLEEVDSPQLGTVMMNLLHPTSAICGMPKFPALRFIAAYEHLNREFYSGYLGPVNMNGISRLYVNLRCMQILRSRAVLYAGAGITHDSIPEKEWDETALKCQTLLNVMNGNLNKKAADELL